MLLRLLTVIVLVSLLCGCVAGNPPSPAPTATATATPSPLIYISGVVLDRHGAPVPGARVALWQGPGLVQMPDNPRYSDENGQFNFTGLQPARYQVAADIQKQQGEVDRRFDGPANIEVTIPDYTVSSVTPAPSQGPLAPGLPGFKVARLGPRTVEVRMESMGGAKSIRGFYVESPAIATAEIVPPDKPLGESEAIEISDPELAGTVHFVASSRVNGNYVVVIDTTV